jgi:hypothetical protein
MFADLVGSTALAGSQDPERTRALLGRFYDVMTEEIERAGGTIEKFAGDAVRAAFGAPSALEDHAERAVHAALAMQRRLAESFEGQLELRIGINTGEVVVGQARAGSSFAPTVSMLWDSLGTLNRAGSSSHRRRTLVDAAWTSESPDAGRGDNRKLAQAGQNPKPLTDSNRRTPLYEEGPCVK